MPARHAYADHASGFAELRLPQGDGPHPVVVLVHGGFWRARYGLELMDDLAVDLAARGFAAWNVEYRRVGAGGGWPATCEDVGAAIDALADVDAPLDLRFVATIGHSAGGHLALWAASRAGRVAVTHAVGQAAVSDLVGGAGLGDGATAAFMGGSPAAMAEAYALASPRALLPLGVPILLVHGDRDEDVPIRQSVEFAREGYAAGDDVVLEIREGEGHYEHLDPGSEAWAAVTSWLEEQR